jgi:hypothetical protein
MRGCSFWTGPRGIETRLSEDTHTHTCTACGHTCTGECTCIHMYMTCGTVSYISEHEYLCVPLCAGVPHTHLCLCTHTPPQ